MHGDGRGQKWWSSEPGFEGLKDYSPSLWIPAYAEMTEEYPGSPCPSQFPFLKRGRAMWDVTTNPSPLNMACSRGMQGLEVVV